ncbi:MAG: hypothetical protein P8188_05525 [Gemmatimonadota bacterium]
MRARQGDTTRQDGARERLDDLIRRVRRRWRARLLLRGGSIVLAAGLAAVALSVWGLEATRFSPGAVLAFRVLTWGGVALLFGWFVLRPLLRRVSDEQVALYLEEHEPTLRASVLGAVEAGRTPEIDPSLLDRVYRRAVVQARAVEDGRRIEQTALYRASGAFTALTLAALALLFFGPLGFRQGARALLPTEDAAAVNPYAILVTPGDLTVARGSDQFVQAELVGFASDEVALLTRSDGEDIRQRITMVPTSLEGEAGYEVLLVGLEESLEYYVESDGIRSATHRIEVVELPYVDRMDHTYRFPGYTGLPVREVEGAGDVAALPGTRVDLTVHPTLGTPGGQLLVDGEDPVALEVQTDGTLTGSFVVRSRGFYRIELALNDGRMVTASPEYTIDVLADQPPSVSITRPGRDTPASPIEELYLEAEADDDYGIDELLLVYSVNGEPEDTVALHSGGGRPLTQVTAGHTLYLEDFEVEPGDVVSYYAVTRDQRQGAGEEVVSDLYFVNIQPFRRDFRQAEQQGGGGGGGGGGAEEPALSELQKQVVAATFNLVRDRERYEADDFDESVAAVALAQGRVREQVQTLAQRMSNRGLANAEDRFRTIAEMLPQALEAMDSAQARLQARTPREALGPEQEALRVIQKAEETYEAYVGQQQGGGGGGGGQGANADDLADLFELELDQLQNQYETVQRGEREQANEEVDELLEKLDELARRQQQQAERQQARSGQQGSASAGGGSASQSQRELADEAEETARQLQRLSRETADPQLAETAQQLQAAADAMRRSAANAGNSGAAEAERALDRIQDARRRLQQDRESRLDEDTRSALDRVQRLRERQEELQQRLDDLPAEAGARQEEIRDMSQEKSDMAREVGQLERDLNRLSQEARQRDEATARELREAVDEIDESKLVQKIQYSRGVLEQRDAGYARVFEEGIESDLERLEQAVREASEAAAEMRGQAGLEESLDEARGLLDRMESLDRRLSDRAQGADSGEAGPEDGAAGGQPGEAGEGQPGEGEPGQGEPGAAGEPSEGRPGEAGAERPQGDPQGQQAGAGNGGGAGEQAQQGGRGGGRSGDAAGEPGTVEGLPGGGATRGDPRSGFDGPLTDEEIRQFQREFQERARDAAELREQLREGGQDVSELDAALRAIRDLQDRETYDDLPQVAILQQTIRESLGRLEFSLRRQVQGEEAPAALSGSEAVPERFRDLVEEYYRRLAREGGGR